VSLTVLSLKDRWWRIVSCRAHGGRSPTFRRGPDREGSANHGNDALVTGGMLNQLVVVEMRGVAWHRCHTRTTWGDDVWVTVVHRRNLIVVARQRNLITAVRDQRWGRSCLKPPHGDASIGGGSRKPGSSGTLVMMEPYLLLAMKEREDHGAHNGL
jgi:hypothetical protein